MPILTLPPITGLRIAWLIPLLFLLGMRVPLRAQCALSCNQNLQVSLDLSGQALITPLLVAPNADNSCPGPLTVSLFNSLGQPLPNPLTCAQIGQVVTARVRHTTSGNFCNGTLEIYDALSPSLSNCADKFIFCNEDSSPASVGTPTGSDNCTAPADLTLTHFDQETSLGCGTFQSGQQVLKRIDRNWTATDDEGNSSTCLQKIWLKHITFAQITYPPNRDNIAAPALECGQDPEDLELTGQPTVNGVPVGASPECEIAATYTDQTVNFCAPAGYTVLRYWTIIDFCNGTLNNRTQIIKVEDKVAPQLTAPDNLTVGTDGFYCTGTVNLPQAIYSDNCSAVTVVPSWFYGTGYGPFSGVPEGEHLVTYTATDACGNFTTATMMVKVEDTSPPQAICASDLQVSISSNGVGYINSNSINAGSYDNCGPVFLSISRNELDYAPQIQVTCADQGSPITFTLRVLDAVGLENFCQMEVTVRDFLKPMLQCPPNLSLLCNQDYTNLSLTGQATATDNCALKSLEYQDIVNLQPCNIGSVTRRWMATDSAGNTKSCNQLITVNVVNSTTVSFPANLTVPGCGSPESILPGATGEPLISGQSCSPLSVNYTDQIFNIAPPACFRIFRSWKVIDHCIYNPNGGSAGIWEHTQIIDVVDHTPPALSLPADVTVGIDPNNCMGMVNLPDVTATDCSNQISLSHDSPYSGAGNTNNASGQYPMGVHIVTFTAADGCGNSIQQSLKITVKDLSPPTAVCRTGVSVQMQAPGLAPLNAQAFDGGCIDYCTPYPSLTFSIFPTLFSCQQTGLQLVTLTVQDTAGNSASCTTQVLVEDPNQICGGGGAPAHQISGTIRTETGLPVHNIPVSLTADGFLEYSACDTLGRFGFEDIPTQTTYILAPYNNANWANGMTTYDLVLISKHILGTDPFNSPYKMLAADANRSGSITTFDIVQFRKVILGILDSLPNNTSWRFVDSSFVFPNPQNPFSTAVPEDIVFDPLVSNQLAQNFVGVKVGDVNESTNPAIARAVQDTLLLMLENRHFQSGETFALPLYLDQWSRLEGLQFELQIDSNLLELERVEFAQPELLGANHVALKNTGNLALSWDNASLQSTENESNSLIILHFRAKIASELRSAISLSETRLSPEAYHREQEERSALALHFNNTSGNALNAALTIAPNPSSGVFWIENPFKNEVSTLKIWNLNGQTVLEQQAVLPGQIAVNADKNLAPGVYCIRLQGFSGVFWGKVVVAD